MGCMGTDSPLAHLLSPPLPTLLTISALLIFQPLSISFTILTPFQTLVQIWTSNCQLVQIWTSHDFARKFTKKEMPVAPSESTVEFYANNLP